MKAATKTIKATGISFNEGERMSKKFSYDDADYGQVQYISYLLNRITIINNCVMNQFNKFNQNTNLGIPQQQ